MDNGRQYLLKLLFWNCRYSSELPYWNYRRFKMPLNGSIDWLLHSSHPIALFSEDDFLGLSCYFALLAHPGMVLFERGGRDPNFFSAGLYFLAGVGNFPRSRKYTLLFGNRSCLSSLLNGIFLIRPIQKAFPSSL